MVVSCNPDFKGGRANKNRPRCCLAALFFSCNKFCCLILFLFELRNLFPLFLFKCGEFDYSFFIFVTNISFRVLSLITLLQRIPIQRTVFLARGQLLFYSGLFRQYRKPNSFSKKLFCEFCRIIWVKLLTGGRNDKYKKSREDGESKQGSEFY